VSRDARNGECMKNNKILMTIALLAMAGSAQPAVTQAQSAGGSGPGTFFERMGQKAKELSLRHDDYFFARDVARSNQEKVETFQQKREKRAIDSASAVAKDIWEKKGYSIIFQGNTPLLEPIEGRNPSLSDDEKDALLREGWAAFQQKYAHLKAESDSSIQLPKLRSVPGVGAARYAATLGRSFNVGLFLGNLIRGNDILLDLLAKIKSLSRNKNFNWLQASKSKKARTLRALLTIARTLLIDQVIAARVNGTPGVLAAAGRAGSRVGSGALQWAKNRLTSSLEKKVL